MGSLGAPQPLETSSERCCNLDLECIVGRTCLGRPASKRTQRKLPQTRSLANPESFKYKDNEIPAALSGLEIKEYLFSDVAEDAVTPLHPGTNPESIQRPGKGNVFQSMTEAGSFISLVLSNDTEFGSKITHATSSWSLVWHRFFLPKTPTLVNLRNRLIAEEVSATNPATNLLFALLCLTAFEIAEGFIRQYPQVKSLQLAVSSYGQEFLFWPPTHRDSIAVCLFIADFRPAALDTSQFVAYRTVKPDYHICRQNCRET
ncbi:hypothetical protein N7462_001411 [Penicillium macrosclerotiorum]|uniref:uncharacterized protein n=1 Tax=Penicillium macrosclerotiorum TaxID=303699 RepID=UPI0025472CFC|nr:uncharacterized protein N7462_001411 [Penicillium macrosclerotiorum]KAJ5691988.1 hypothetical protein N7462_001411 [Penicillium macrosclerotiorum]